MVVEFIVFFFFCFLMRRKVVGFDYGPLQMAVIAVVHPTMDQLVGCVIGDVVVDLLRIIQQDPECCVSILSNLSSPSNLCV